MVVFTLKVNHNYMKKILLLVNIRSIVRSRAFPALLMAFLAAGCTAAMVGGSDSYRVEREERAATVVASDSAITTTVKGKFAADAVVSVFDIGVRTWNGTVTLTGAVGSFRARDDAEAIARNTRGVTAVNNLIEVEDRSVAQ